MPVTAYNGPNVSTGNGVTTVFPYTFRILAQADLKVTVDGVVQTIGTHYSVSGVGAAGGGNVTFVTAPANGSEVARLRDRAYTRETDYQRNGKFDEETVDADFDAAIMLLQQLNAINLRAIKAPESVSDDQVISAVDWAARASKFFGFNASSVLGLYSLASAGALTVSAFIETLLDDASAAEAASTLGLDAEGKILIGEASGNAPAVLMPFGGAQIINGKIALSVNAGALTVSLVGLDGNAPSASNPVLVRVPQLTSNVFNGTYAVRKVTAALSMTVSSGSTLAGGSGIASAVYIGLIDNAGTLELAVSKRWYGTPAVISTTAEGGAGAADGTGAYSTTARSNVPYCVIGRWKSTQTTAGTWASVTGEFQLYPFPFKKPKVTKYLAAATAAHTYDWDTLYADVTVLGGGGGGGGAAATAAGQLAIAGPGAAGGWCKKSIAVTETGTQASYTVGAAGTAGAAGANNGGDGGDTTWSDGVNSLTAGGGDGGLGAAAASTQIPSLGGTSSGGDENVAGNCGVMGWIPTTAATVASSKGGDSIRGAGGRQNFGTSVSGIAGLGNGSGGAGAANAASQSAIGGGAGTPGAIICEEHYA